jgi:hypothetical protein
MERLYEFGAASFSLREKNLCAWLPGRLLDDRAKSISEGARGSTISRSLDTARL